jgi:hypothetical protein
MAYFKFPDGTRVDMKGCVYKAVGRTFCAIFQNDTIFSYACVDSTGADGMVTAVDAVTTPTNITDTGSFTWTSLTPNTYSISGGVNYDGTIAGLGFAGAPLSFHFDDGGGHVLPFVPYSTSNTAISGNIPLGVAVAGSFTLYYSLDTGSTWTTTGLTLTIS